MTSCIQNKQDETRYNMLLVPEINYLEVPKANKNWNSNRPPLPKKMKESALTSVTQDPEKMYSPYQQTLKSSYLDFTPNISTKHNNSHLTEQFNPRTNVKYSSSQDKIQKQLNAKETISELDQSIRSSRFNKRQQEIQKLKIQNQTLKRRLSLRNQCSCKTPYVQQEVQYVRHHFHQHIKKYHIEKTNK